MNRLESMLLYLTNNYNLFARVEILHLQWRTKEEKEMQYTYLDRGRMNK